MLHAAREVSFVGAGDMLDLIVFSDVRLYREGLMLILSRAHDLRVAAVAETPLRVVQLVLEAKPAVALLDLLSADCTVLARDLLRIRPDLGLVALSSCGDEDGVLRCAETGFLGFVPRDGSPDDLLGAIRGVARGELVCSPRLAARIARRLAVLNADRVDTPCGDLSRRELAILELVEQGLGNKQIAQRLHISVATVKNHVHAVLHKLHVTSRDDAARLLRQSSRTGTRSTSA